MIRVSQISKSYGMAKALDNVSLEVHTNEVVSIIGNSGSGKSTLIKCLAGLESYESGSIEINVATRNTFRGIGMVFSSNNLFPHLTVLQNLMLAPTKVLGMSPKEAQERAVDLLTEMGIWSVKDAYPESLSSGQCQRAAIARALMMQPKILLLDEPTSSLDPVSTSEVLNVLTPLKDSVTIVLVTHNLDFARSISDRIIFMSGGKICEQGTPSEVINHPKAPQTKSYINHCMNMVYEIESPKYDHPELNARIEVFSMRYRLSYSDTYSLQLAVEELLNLIPLEAGVGLLIKKSDNGLKVEAVLPGVGGPYLSGENVKDELSCSILEGLCESIEEAPNEKNQTVIKMTIKENTI